MKIKTLAIAALLATLGVISGCATINRLTTPTAQPFVQAAVSVAVATAVQKGVPAAQIKAVAQEALLVDEGASAPLDAVEGMVNMKVASMHLPLADLAAVQILMAALDATVKAQIAGATNGAVTAQTQVAIKTVLENVITATSAYGV